jgi:ADP-heptose:LPS heptosyltransferase
MPLPEQVQADVSRATAQVALLERPHGRRLCGIFLTEHLGDIVACEPVIRYLREQHPEESLVWVTRGAYAPLLQHHPLLDAVVTVDSLAAVNPLIESGLFDRCVDLHVHGKPTGIPGLIHEKVVGTRDIDTVTYLQEAPLLRAFCLGAGLPPLDLAPQLFVGEQAERRAASTVGGAPFVVLHTMANEPSRCWASGHWRVLVEQLLARTRCLIFEVGLRPTINRRHARFIPVAGELSLLETAALISKAALFVGVESGPAHLANVFEVNSLVLAGIYRGTPLFPYTGFFARHREQSVIQHPASVSTLPLDAVMEHPQLQRFLHAYSDRPVV